MNGLYLPVIDFIKHFSNAEDVFLHGCCYWFAQILVDRFDGKGYLVDIFYEPVEGHYIAGFFPMRIRQNVDDDVRYFDIRGDVTDEYKDKALENMWLIQRSDHKRYTKLMCDCRDFIDPENYPDSIKGIFDDFS